MAATIEFNRYVIKTEPVGMFSEPLYFSFGEYGSRNLTESKTGAIVRSTALMEISRKSQTMRTFIKASMDCEGGMLKVQGRDMKPENYIALWRRAVEEAVPLQDYLECAGGLYFVSKSIVRQLEDYRKAYPDKTTWFLHRKSREINDLIIELCFAEGVQEETRMYFGKPLELTKIAITKDNCHYMTGLINRINEVCGYSVKYAWQCTFHEQAYLEAKDMWGKHNRAV